MKENKNQKKSVLIILLVILLLALAVGYAAFSELLTIEGTANAKGSFDMIFDSATFQNGVGFDEENSKVEISEDKNTLTVDVKDLSYPGAGTEVAVVIKNNGTVPARVDSLNPTNITGNGAIVIDGLDLITEEHPTIEPGETCSLTFTVVWKQDAEMTEEKQNASFSLEIQYTQDTPSSIFDGNTSHTDIPKETVSGNVTNETIEGSETLE